MKTYMQTAAEVKREWHLIDAQGQVLGQVATQIATLLMGKHRPTYTPHIESGDYVVVINAQGIEVTRNKAQQKMYYRYSGFPGGLRKFSFAELMERSPEVVIEKAVYNMLPDNRLRGPRMARLKVYAGADHQHESQLKKVASKA